MKITPIIVYKIEATGSDFLLATDIVHARYIETRDSQWFDLYTRICNHDNFNFQKTKKFTRQVTGVELVSIAKALKEALKTKFYNDCPQTAALLKKINGVINA